MVHPVRRHGASRQHVLGVVLVLAGGVPLAVRAGMLDASVVSGAWRLWPLALIVAGLGLIVLRRLDRTPIVALAAVVIGLFVGGVLAGGGINGIGCADARVTDTQLSRAGTFSGPAAVRLELNCGSLTVGTAGDGRRSPRAAPSCASNRGTADRSTTARRGAWASR